MSDNVLAVIEGASEVDDSAASRHLVELMKADEVDAIVPPKKTVPKVWTDVVNDILPHGTRYRHPFLADDWIEALKSEDADDIMFVMSQPSDIATAKEVATALALVKGSWFVECEDSTGARHSLARIGKTFRLDGSDSLFCASFPIDHDSVEWIDKSAVSKPFAGFADFKACLAAAVERGASEEDARKICGELQTAAEARSKRRTKHLSHHPSASTLKILKRAIPVYISKVEERFVMGIVLEPEPFDGKGDAQQDVYSEDEVRTAAHKFMADFRNLGLMHTTFVNGSVKILESFLAPASFDMGGIKVKKGTWLMAIRVIEDNLWADIKAGKLTGFSIGGTAVRKPA